MSKPRRKKGRTSKPPGAAEREVDAVMAVASVLQDAREPVSRARLLRRLREAGCGMSRRSLDRRLAVLFKAGLAMDGSKGLQWTFNPNIRAHIAGAMGKTVWAKNKSPQRHTHEWCLR